jgi:hypothetical protein
MRTTLSIRYGPRRLQPYGFDRWAPPKLIFSAAPRSSLADAYAFVLIELRRDLRRDRLRLANELGFLMGRPAPLNKEGTPAPSDFGGLAARS